MHLELCARPATSQRFFVWNRGLTRGGAEQSELVDYFAERPWLGRALEMLSVKFEGKLLTIDDAAVLMPHEIRDAFALGDKVIVFLDPDADLGRSGQYRNLLALDPAGASVWQAELPTDRDSDVFTRIVSREPLVADSFSSFECEIDPRTGRLLSMRFFK